MRTIEFWPLKNVRKTQPVALFSCVPYGQHINKQKKKRSGEKAICIVQKAGKKKRRAAELFEIPFFFNVTQLRLSIVFPPEKKVRCAECRQRKPKREKKEDRLLSEITFRVKYHFNGSNTPRAQEGTTRTKRLLETTTTWSTTLIIKKKAERNKTVKKKGVSKQNKKSIKIPNKI